MAGRSSRRSLRTVVTLFARQEQCGALGVEGHRLDGCFALTALAIVIADALFAGV